MSWEHVVTGAIVALALPAIPVFGAYRIIRWQRQQLGTSMSGETLLGVILGVVLFGAIIFALVWYAQAMGCSLVVTQFAPDHPCYPLVTP